MVDGAPIAANAIFDGNEGKRSIENAAPADGVAAAAPKEARGEFIEKAKPVIKTGLKVASKVAEEVLKRDEDGGKGSVDSAAPTPGASATAPKEARGFLKLGEKILKAGVDTAEKYVPQKQQQPAQKRGKTEAGKPTTSDHTHEGSHADEDHSHAHESSPASGASSSSGEIAAGSSHSSLALGAAAAPKVARSKAGNVAKKVGKGVLGFVEDVIKRDEGAAGKPTTGDS